MCIHFQSSKQLIATELDCLDVVIKAEKINVTDDSDYQRLGIQSSVLLFQFFLAIVTDYYYL